MAWQRGEVLLVSYPYTNLTTNKARPAVILSDVLYHSEQPDLVLGALTSNVAAATGSLDYVLRDWNDAGLKFPTAFKPVVATLDPSLVVHRIGCLTPGDLREVLRRVSMVFGLQGSVESTAVRDQGRAPQ